MNFPVTGGTGSVPLRLLSRVDATPYQAKEAGRNRIELCRPNPPPPFSGVLQGHLHRAIQHPGQHRFRSLQGRSLVIETQAA